MAKKAQLFSKTKSFSLIKGSSLRAELTRHAGGTFILKVVGLFLQLISGIILARILGAEGYGIYAFPMAVVALLSIPTTMGLPNLILRNIAQYQANKEFGLMKGLLLRANQFVTFLSLLFILAAFLIFFYFGKLTLSDERGITFALGLILLPLISLKQVRMAALRGLRKVILGLVPETMVRPLLFLAAIFILFYVRGTTLSPHVVMILQIIATLGAFAFGSFLLVHNLPDETKTATVSYDSQTWLRSALPFMFLGLMQIINKQTDLIMLGMLQPMTEVGIYKAVVHGSTLVVFVLTAVNTAQNPQISRLWALNDIERLQKMITVSARIVAVATLASAGVLVFWGDFFLGLLFGEEYRLGFTTLRILCIGQIINGLAGSTGSILNMTGFEYKSAQAVGIAAFLNVILNLFLIPKFGIEGAAIASAISLSVWNIILVYWVKKHTGIHSTALGVFPKKSGKYHH